MNKSIEDIKQKKSSQRGFIKSVYLGLAIIALTMIARLLGGFQYWEWLAFDLLMRLRPSEPTDERIVIIGITEQDINRLGAYPLPDKELADLITTLQQYKPRGIGLDIVRDLPVEPGHQQLTDIFENSNNLVGVEKIYEPTIAKPPSLSNKYVGFVDILIDLDGKTRRSLLGSIRPEDSQIYTFSFPLKLAELYLENKGITLENGLQNPSTMRFGLVEIPMFTSQKGGYQKTDDFGVQMLLNFRQNIRPFLRLSLDDINNANFDPSWIQDAVILIGITTPSIKDFVNISAIKSVELPGKIYGVEFQAHVVSQIISAVEDNRPLLKSWNESLEYLWIMGWGILGLIISRLIFSPKKILITVCFSSVILITISYLFLLAGWWIPLVPSLAILTLNGVILAAFFQYERFLKMKIETRQSTIEYTFTTIHNGPLQTLANLLRKARDQDPSQEYFLEDLERLNQEIREIGEYLKLESLGKEESFRLGNGKKINLNQPLHQLFYEVYSEILNRDFPYFSTLKVKARSFEPIEDKYINYQQKRELCQFLEEILCNVGKHARGVTKLNAIGKFQDGTYYLNIQDNGENQGAFNEGRGTQQCKKLAQQLGGIFKRNSLTPKGTLCQLTWPIIPSKHRKIKLKQILDKMINIDFKS